MELANQIIGLMMVAVPLIAGAAAIVARSRGARLVRNMALLAFAPAILMALVLGIGSLFSPAHDSPFSQLAFAVMLIGIFAVIPWALVCAIGFAIGYRIRRRNPPPEPLAATAAPPPQPTLSRPAPRIIPAGISQPAHQEFSPDGSIRVDIHPVEWASSQFAATPRVVRVSDGQVLCNMLGTDWDAQVSYPREAYVWLGLRRYCSPGYLFAEFDLVADRYRIAMNSLDESDEEGPLGDVTDRLEVWWDKASNIAAARIMETHQQAPVIKPHPFAAWRTALVILVGTLAAIAGLTYMSEKTGIDPPHMPMSVPHVPRFPH
ncbi:MAG: hypothetical protein U1E68_09575 [Sphingomonadaceae bacterium]